MIDLIALTIGMLAFVSWSAVLMFGGYAYRRRKEQQAQRARIARLIADAKASKPQFMPVRNREPSAETRKRANA